MASSSPLDPTDGRRRPWTRRELILAFSLYSRIPFGRIHERNPEIIELAAHLGRTPGALSYKLANLASLDPALQSRGIRGASHGARADAAIWGEFADDPEGLAEESERLLADLQGRELEAEPDIAPEPMLVGREREAVVRLRVTQGFFRRMVLARYEETCCVTGLKVRELLVASHIAPWARFPDQRMNPRNALCLNPLHDRAFDRGLLTVDEGLRVRVSSAVPGTGAEAELLRRFDGAPLRHPARFSPDEEFLAYHRENVFRG
jgi:putative restriction endonuclease